MNRKEQILRFLETQPDDAFLNYALAQEYISEGLDDKAEALFLKLTDQQPEYIATYYHYGKLLERKGAKDSAMEMYRKGIAIGQKLRELHAVSELQSALLELEYD